MKKLTVVLGHARQGFHVFPLAPKSKRPLIAKEQGGSGCHDATTDEARIRTWFTAEPRANIGIAGGDGLLFIDVDAHKGADITDWNLPKTRTVRTPNGGYHLYFHYDGLLPCRNENDLAPGVCIKAAGGYVVGPGSAINGDRYTWIDEHQPIADLPERIAAMIRGIDVPPLPSYHQGGSRPTSSDDSDISSDIGGYWLARAMDKTREGVGDEIGYWLAQQLLIEEKHGAPLNVRNVLLAYAQQATLNPRHPFTESDVDRWHTSASRSRVVQVGAPARAQRIPDRAEQAPTEPLPSAESGGSYEIPYGETPRGLVWKKPTRDGNVDIPLTNFTARIIADITEDDGTETRRHFEIEAWLHGRPTRCVVAAERFAAMNWPAEHIGAMAILHPGLSVKEHARTAIQLLSHNIPQRRTYTHMGWITFEDGLVYLHAGGAIGSHGAVREVSIALQGDLRAYSLPDPPDAEPLKAALRASLKILELAPDPITFPLYAAIWLAPCAEADTSLYLAGQTGEGKSELAALAQQHYGAAMDARHLPAAWSSSGNALEALAFLAKDALLVIDDFVPTGSAADIQRQHRDADRVLRAQGNHSARQRMRADTSLRLAKPPRGLILSTGEDIPRGHSLRGRMFILELSPGNLRWDLLSACQAHARNGLYAQAMAGYLQWLAGHLIELRRRWGEELAALRANASLSAMHRRTPEIVANLALSFWTFLEFAYYAGAISRDEQSSLWQRGWKALGETAQQQTTYQVASEPTRRFLELLNSAIASGKAHLETPRGSEKPGTDDQLWGWELVTTGIGQNARDEWRPLGPCVGWLDGTDLYLNPDAAYATVQQLGQIGGDGLGVSAQTLWKRMHERHLLASTDTKRATLKVRRVCAGGNQNVIHVRLESLSTHPSPDKPDSDAAKGRVLSGSGVGNAGDVENPTTNPTESVADNSKVLAPIVGFVGSGDVREAGPLTNGNSPHADVTLLSNADPIPTANPTTKPDNAGARGNRARGAGE